MSKIEDIKKVKDILVNAHEDFVWCAETMDGVNGQGLSSHEIREMVCKIEDILWTINYRVLKKK